MVSAVLVIYSNVSQLYSFGASFYQHYYNMQHYVFLYYHLIFIITYSNIFNISTSNITTDATFTMLSVTTLNIINICYL